MIHGNQTWAPWLWNESCANEYFSIKTEFALLQQISAKVDRGYFDWLIKLKFMFFPFMTYNGTEQQTKPNTTKSD